MRPWLLCLVVLTACESDVDRMHRLELEQGMSCLEARTEKDFLKAMQASDRCKLATRELNAFMEKR